MPADAVPSEEYMKDNDYTLSVKRTEEKVLRDNIYPLTTMSSITKTFNFLSQQVTTVTRDYIFQVGAYKYGGSSGVSTTTTQQNFADIQSPEEITKMHGRLVAYGGQPPALEDILDDSGLKKMKLPKPAGNL